MAQTGGGRGPGSWLLAGPFAPCVHANQTGASAQRSAHGESSADGRSVSTSPWGCPRSILSFPAAEALHPRCIFWETLTLSLSLRRTASSQDLNSFQLPSGPRECFQHAELPCTLQTPLGAGQAPVNLISPASPLFQEDKVREHPEREKKRGSGPCTS